MLRFDRVLTAPSRAELDRTLSEAAQAANKGCRVRTLAWTATNTEALLRDSAAAPEGFRQWNGEGESKKRGFANETRSALAVAWWTDPLKRTHYRVGADRVYCASSDVEHLFCPYCDEERPPLWVTHPENVYFRGEGERLTPFAVCRCGASGSPESLGWMGTECAACHDRAEEVGAVPVPPGNPARILLVGHTGWVGPVLFTPDGRSVLSGDRCGFRVLAWDLATGTPREVIAGSAQLWALALSPDGQTLATGYGSGEVLLTSLKDGTRQQAFTTGSGTDRVYALAFSPDGALLAVAPYGRVELWDLPTASRRAIIAEGLRGCHSAGYLAFSPDGRTLAIGHAGQGGVLLYDLASGQGRNLEVPGVEYYAGTVAFTPDGHTLGVMTGTAPTGVRLVDLPSGRVVGTPAFDRANDLAFSPDGRVLAVAGHDDSLRLFSVPEGRPLGVYVWHLGNLNAVAFSPGGRWLVTSSDDGFVKLWPMPALLPGPPGR
jgi:hypothetical protein